MMEDIFCVLCRSVMCSDASVRQYGYRQALPVRPLFHIERDKEFEEMLAEKAGKKMDNHTLYEITYPDGTSFSIKFSDSRMYIGLGVDERPW